MANFPFDMSVTILGSGTCVPSLKRRSSAILVDAAECKCVFDFGLGAIHRLLEAGVTIFDIHAVFLSHLHPDHCSELISLFFSTKYRCGAHRKFPLTLVAATGFSSFYEKLKAAFGEWVTLSEEFLQIVELDNSAKDSYNFNGLSVNTLPMNHTEYSIGYRITGPSGKSLVYSGDTDYCENLIELAADADVFICESALPDEMKVDGHMTPSVAGEIARRAGVKTLVLTHFYPECDKVDIAAQCRKSYAGPLILANDMINIKV